MVYIQTMFQNKYLLRWFPKTTICLIFLKFLKKTNIHFLISVTLDTLIVVQGLCSQRCGLMIVDKWSPLQNVMIENRDISFIQNTTMERKFFYPMLTKLNYISFIEPNIDSSILTKDYCIEIRNQINHSHQVQENGHFENLGEW